MPIFSKSTPSIIFNAVAAWADSILTKEFLTSSKQANETQARRALNWISSKYLPQIGWEYSADSTVVDLMHQTLIIEALINHQRDNLNEMKAIEVFSNFKSGFTWIDTIKTCSLPEAIRVATNSKKSTILFRGNIVLITQGKKARQWSLGGILSCFGLLAEKGEEKEYWISQIRAFPYNQIDDYGDKNIRELMCLARGAALSLKALKNAK